MYRLIIKRNKKYTEEIRKEEKQRISEEPIGDPQSLSDMNRWCELYKTLEEKRIRYNISQSKNKESDKNVLIKTKKLIEDTIIIKKQIIENTKLPKKASRFQRIYSYWTDKPNNYDIQLKQYENEVYILRELHNILNEIDIQLPLYEPNISYN